jgi:hypothetical protein
MTDERARPFDTLESAHEFVDLLRGAADEEFAQILEEIAVAQATPGAGRRVDALRLVNYKLNGLRQHLLASQIALNDLRMLRRLLVAEKPGEPSDVEPS